ncbi:MAG: alpha/beta hydrolase [Desulfomonile sp.]|nr:alpha/beta hydrolase [Desulfomonile sp.]
MPEVVIQGRKIGYEAQPRDFDPSPRAVVFIHGSGGDREDWRAQLDGLANVATMVALELPGHGASDPPGETAVDAYARWTCDFIDALGLRKVVLVGCSLGSAITQWIALEGKPWLEALGIVGGGARLRVNTDFLNGLQMAPAKALEMLADFALRLDPDPAIYSALNEKFKKTSAELVHGDLSACDRFDVMERIAEISVPTWIIVGEQDRLTPPKYSQFLKDKIAGARLDVIPAAGHLVMIEQPVEFNRCLKEFLSQLDR